MACLLPLLISLWALFSNGLSFNRHHGRAVVNLVSVQDRWFVQRLDHFSGADTRVWKQRYFMNDSFTQTDGPVFLMIGGEGEANKAWMTSGTWLTYAEKFGAFCLMLEHRFYGKSHPTENMNLDNLRYLSSRQALADIGHFQTVMTQVLGLYNRKWVVFGGSYPGSLAAWYRMKYPHLAHAAVASSAPVNAVINFTEYLEVVQSSLGKNKSTCPTSIKEASESLLQLLKYQENYEKITDDFKLCELLQINSAMDLAFFLDAVAEYIMDVVQYNNDNREFEGVKGTNMTIQVVCDIMADLSIGAPYDRYVAVIQSLLKAHQEKCIDANYKKYIEKMSNTSWEGSTGERQWVYQTCTEFGFFQSSDSISQPFSGFPLRFYVQQCSDIYGPALTFSAIADSIQETNEYYGGFNIQGSRIIFPNGLIDPWHALGINANLSSELLAIQMPDAAHCADMYPARPEEPACLPFTRQYIFEILNKWLQL
ncbi:LOW QUALITY PROTEIN: putative serine protease K12H4.7 [Bombina bombina]|uniref:LOW QUALITY PROTEIN: putative serine protease K12H4.7 n=1 Tax=Bombina bombina TaxID=8345 RepID=UPI00235A9606|nr:LOW QUALITY PROTEIN: putative serine protease K12H4.7 [Bombina bombina]